MFFAASAAWAVGCPIDASPNTMSRCAARDKRNRSPIGSALAVLGLIFAVTTPIIAALSGLGAVLLYEHAFVQAGQSVPLA